MQDIVIRLCGPYPDNYIKVEIENNPDFVFTPDPLFPTKQLLDEEENVVYVNSFTECEHYVMGGWDYDIVVEKEYSLQNILFGTFCVISLFLVITYLRKIRKNLS